MSSQAQAPAVAAVSEPDRVGDLPHPRETLRLFGHAAAQTEFLDAYSSGRLHHAWLLTGPQGIGKATLAYHLARVLLRDADEGDVKAKELPAVGETVDPVFHQVASLAHPDLLVLRRPWLQQRKRLATAITVDEARRLRPFLGKTTSGRWRVVIVDAADEMNISAVNALLKGLEEPPVGCVFILVSSAPGLLPVTIRSRCRHLRLDGLDRHDLDSAVRAALDASGVEVPNGFDLSLDLAEGSPGMALRTLSHEGADLYMAIVNFISGLPRADYGRVHQLADALARPGAEDRYDLFHDLLSGLIGRLVCHAAGGSGAIRDEAGLADRIAAAGSLAQWARLWDTLQRAKAEADTLNLDRKTFVLETFFQLERAAHGGA